MAAPRTAKTPARDVALEITNLIIAKLEEGVPPWSRPWSTTGAGGRPLRHNGEPYSGINTIYLWAVADAFGFRSRHWMTYRQAEELGGQVRRGEKGSLSVFYSGTKSKTDPRTGEDKKGAFFLRHYVVFNADQIDNLPEHFHPPVEPPAPLAPSIRQDAIDAFFAAIPAEVRHGGDRACFVPTFDFIQMPPREAFQSADHYCSTRAHETIHWTGHASRLGRTFGRRFGDNAYAFEELVAELGNGMVCAELGLPNEVHVSHASYLKSWLNVLRADKTAIIHAAAKAEQAFNYLRAFGRPDPASTGDPAADEPHRTLEAA